MCRGNLIAIADHQAADIVLRNMKRLSAPNQSGLKEAGQFLYEANKSIH